MATRSIVTIEGFDHALYIHWDGYPEAKLPWLTTFYKDFYEKRGFDESYLLAQLIRSGVRLQSQFNLDESLHTGWGVVSSKDDCGQEYTYTLCKDGSIKVNGKKAWKNTDKPLTPKESKKYD